MASLPRPRLWTISFRTAGMKTSSGMTVIGSRCAHAAMTGRQVITCKLTVPTKIHAIIFHLHAKKHPLMNELLWHAPPLDAVGVDVISDDKAHEEQQLVALAHGGDVHRRTEGDGSANQRLRFY